MSEMRILCYGNSNTYGFNAENGSRFSPNIRWPSVMAQHLGAGARVIEEGCNGRTIFDVSPIGESLNGTAYLPGCIDRHNPMDLIIIYLGINDLFLSAGMTVTRIAGGLMSLISISEERSKSPGGKPARILIIAPPRHMPATMRGRSRAHGSLHGNTEEWRRCTAASSSMQAGLFRLWSWMVFISMRITIKSSAHM